MNETVGNPLDREGAPTCSGGPLDGVRILDVTSVMMGPLATQILGDLGAEVICVEAVGGDPCRNFGKLAHPHLSGTALNLLRNKRNITLNLKNAAGWNAFLQLARTCDVVITNLRPDPRRRLGFTYENLRQVRPDIIFCHAQGWSLASGRADDAAYDDIAQASGGLADLHAKQGGEPASSPLPSGDQVAGLTIVYAVLAALYHRQRTGEGQSIDIPMVDTLAAFVLAMHGHDGIPQPPLGPPGYARVINKLRRPNATKDGYLQIVLYSRQAWIDLLSVDGRTGAENDQRLITPQSRAEFFTEMYGEMAEIMKTKTTAEWVAWCKERSIACAPLVTLEELVESLPDAHHPEAGAYKEIPLPVNFSLTPGSVRRPAPLIGEHNHELLVEAGLSDDQIVDLINSGGLLSPEQIPR